GNIGSLISGFKTHPYSSATANDNVGNRYETGGFAGVQNNGSAGTTLTSKGDFDIYVRKYGGQPASSDSSEQVFSIKNAHLEFANTTVVCRAASIGHSSDTVLRNILCNNGNASLVISNLIVSGSNNEDFKIR